MSRNSDETVRTGGSVGGSYTANYPAVNAMGTRPLEGIRAGNDAKGRFGQPQATGIMATGRFGGSREMKPGATRSPVGRGRDRGR